MPLDNQMQTAAAVKPKMDITRFFGKQSTPTARSGAVEALDTVMCVDMTTASNINKKKSIKSQSQSGSTPTINKVLFNTTTITSISAKKDNTQVKSVPLKEAPEQEQGNAVESRPPPHTVVRIPPHAIHIRPAANIGVAETSIDATTDNNTSTPTEGFFEENDHDEVSRLEGSPARSEKMSEDDEDKEEESGGKRGQKQNPADGDEHESIGCSLSSLQHPSATASPSPQKKSEQEGPLSVAPLLASPSVLVVKTPQESDVGRPVEVFWPAENSWYCGVIDQVRGPVQDDKEEQPTGEVSGVVSGSEVAMVEVEEEKEKEAVTEKEKEATTVDLDESNSNSKEQSPPSPSGAGAAVGAAGELVSYHISYADGDDEWIDGDDLRALVFADSTPEEKSARQAEVEIALASLVKKKKKTAAKKPRAPRKPKEAGAGAAAGGGKAKGRPAKAAASAGKEKAKAKVPPARPLPPDVLLRVSVNEKKMAAVLNALSATRGLVRAHHRRIYDDILAASQQPQEQESEKEQKSSESQPLTLADAVTEEEISETPKVNEEGQTEEVTGEKEERGEEEQREEQREVTVAPHTPIGLNEMTVQRLIWLQVQDSALPLSTLVDSLTADLRALLLPTPTPSALSPSSSSTLPSSSATDVAVWHAKYCDAIPLTEYIKSIATRSCYGFRSAAELKLTSMFEDASPLALWRWEAINTSINHSEGGADHTLVTPPVTSHAAKEQEQEQETAEDRAAKRLLCFQTSEALKTVKADFQRAGKVVKAVQRVVGELHKAAASSTISAGAKAKAIMVGGSTLDPASEITLAGLEDKVTKCQMEVQKAVDRRQQVEKKWETSLEEAENKERKRKEEAERKLLALQKKQEQQQNQQQLKLSKLAASEEAKHARATAAALASENKRKAKEDAAAAAAAAGGGDEEAGEGGGGSKKKAKVLSEKELKAQTLLAKQKNLMSSFFKSTPSRSSEPVSSGASSSSSEEGSAASSSTATLSHSIPEGPLQKDGSPLSPIAVTDSSTTTTTSSAHTITVDLTGSSCSSAAAAAAGGGAAVASSSKLLPSRKPQRLTAAAKLIQTAREQRPLDTEQFEHSIAPDTPFSMGDISRFYRSRYSDQGEEAKQKKKKKNKLRKPVLLSITVSVEQQPVFVPGEGFRGPSAFQMAMGGGAAAGGGYSEQKEVQVDSRKRLFSFSEDLRPPYYGTWSKRSQEVTGRRPFAKDMSNNMDYEVDSEAEWEEEEEGEDIIMSEDEDEVEGNDMVYDEFFCPDDEVVYADHPGGGEDPHPSSGTTAGGGGDTVNAIFNAMQQSGGGSRELQSCIAGVRLGFCSPECDRRRAQGLGEGEGEGERDTDFAQLSRYSAVIDPCAYWSPLPETQTQTQGGEAGGVRSLSPAADRTSTGPQRPPLLLSTPSMVAARASSAGSTKLTKATDSATADAKKERQEKEYYRHFQDALIPCLVSFLHGKKGGLDKMLEGFLCLWKEEAADEGKGKDKEELRPPTAFYIPPSKSQIKSKIKEIASNKGGKAWLVHSEVLAQCPADVQERCLAATAAAMLTSAPPLDKDKEGLPVLCPSQEVLSFPVVSATVAIESMSSVLVSSSASSSSSSSSSSSTATPSKGKDHKDKDKDREKDREKDKEGKGQPSLLHFFGKPRPPLALSTAGPDAGPAVTDLTVTVGQQEPQQEQKEEEEEEDVYPESQKGISWWGESKGGEAESSGSGSSCETGSPASLARKRVHEEVSVEEVPGEGGGGGGVVVEDEEEGEETVLSVLSAAQREGDESPASKKLKVHKS